MYRVGFPVGGQVTTSVRFRGKPQTDAYTQASAQWQKNVEEVLNRAFYDVNGEVITGLHILKATKSAAVKRTWGPAVLLNPFKWLPQMYYFFESRGHSQWVYPNQVMKNLALKFSLDGRTPEEYEFLQDSVKQGLEALLGQRLLNKVDRYDFEFGPSERVYRITRQGRQAFSHFKKLGEKLEKQPVAPVQEPVKQELIMTEAASQLQSQVQKLKSELSSYESKAREVLQRVNLQKNVVESARVKTSQAETEIKNIQVTSATEQDLLKIQQFKHLQAELADQESLLTALERQHNLAKTRAFEMTQGVSDLIAEYEGSLRKIEIMKVNADSLEMTNQMEQKRQVDLEKDEILREAMIRHHAIQTALDEKNPEALVKALLSVRSRTAQTLAETVREGDSSVQKAIAELLAKKSDYKIQASS